MHSFLDKPPLGIWAQALIPLFVGVHLWSLHLMNILVYGLMLVLVWRFVKRWASPDIAAYSTLIFGSNLGIIIYSRTTKMEMLLLLCLFLVHMLGYSLLQHPKQGRLYEYLGLAAAGGFLVKSGFALILPLMSVLMLSLNAGFRQQLFRLNGRLILGAGVLFATLVGGILYWQSTALGELWPSYIASLITTSKYNSAYLRFGVHLDVLILFIAALLPWSALGLGSLSTQKLFKENSLESFALAWMLGTLAFLVFFYGQEIGRAHV